MCWNPIIAPNKMFTAMTFFKAVVCENKTQCIFSSTGKLLFLFIAIPATDAILAGTCRSMNFL